MNQRLEDEIERAIATGHARDRDEALALLAVIGIMAADVKRRDGRTRPIGMLRAHAIDRIEWSDDLERCVITVRGQPDIVYRRSDGRGAWNATRDKIERALGAAPGWCDGFEEAAESMDASMYNSLAEQRCLVNSRLRELDAAAERAASSQRRIDAVLTAHDGGGVVAPEAIRGIEGLHRQACILLDKIGVVYFLCLGGDVVYVGQSTSLWPSRLGGHSDKDFDAVYYIVVPEGKVYEIERHYIELLAPRYNRVGARSASG